MPRCLSLVLFALTALLPSAAYGAEWAIEPSIETRASNTDNINLTPTVHENVFGMAVSPRVTFARRTEVSEVAGKASLGINRYPGNSELDTTDANFTLASQLSAERSLYGLTAAYTRDSTLQSELAATGVVQARRQRNLVTLAPSWSYSLTERSSTFARYQYDRAQYEAGANLEDYSNQQATGGYQYLLSVRTAVTLSGSYSRYETVSGSSLTSTYSLNSAMTHSATERLTFGAGIGFRRSDTTITSKFCPFNQAVCDLLGIPQVAQRETSDDGLSYNASADYKWERTSANAVASRDLNPTGGGLVVQTDRLAFGVGHEFSERLSGNANGAWLVSRYIGGLGSDVDYYSLNSSLSWKLDQWWSAGGGYSFVYQKAKGAPDSATANMVYLSVSYNWPKISISR